MCEASKEYVPATVPAATNDSDSDLLLLGKAFRDVDAKRFASDDENDPLVHQWWSAAEAIMGIKPLTHAGRRVTAYLLASLARDSGEDGPIERCCSVLAESLLAEADG